MIEYLERYWALRMLGAEEWLVTVVKVMYADATIGVRVKDDVSEEFGVKVGVHQGSVVSLLPFTIVLEALSKEFGEGLP